MGAGVGGGGILEEDYGLGSVFVEKGEGGFWRDDMSKGESE